MHPSRCTAAVSRSIGGQANLYLCSRSAAASTTPPHLLCPVLLFPCHLTKRRSCAHVGSSRSLTPDRTKATGRAAAARRVAAAAGKAAAAAAGREAGAGKAAAEAEGKTVVSGTGTRARRSHRRLVLRTIRSMICPHARSRTHTRALALPRILVLTLALAPTFTTTHPLVTPFCTPTPPPYPNPPIHPYQISLIEVKPRTAARVQPRSVWVTEFRAQRGRAAGRGSSATSPKPERRSSSTTRRSSPSTSPVRSRRLPNAHDYSASLPKPQPQPPAAGAATEEPASSGPAGLRSRPVVSPFEWSTHGGSSFGPKSPQVRSKY